SPDGHLCAGDHPLRDAHRRAAVREPGLGRGGAHAHHRDAVAAACEEPRRLAGAGEAGPQGAGQEAGRPVELDAPLRALPGHTTLPPAKPARASAPSAARSSAAPSPPTTLRSATGQVTAAPEALAD